MRGPPCQSLQTEIERLEWRRMFVYFGLNVILAKAAGRNANTLVICIAICFADGGHLSAVRVNCAAFQPQ